MASASTLGSLFTSIDTAQRLFARMDPSHFIPYIMRDEQTGQFVTQAPIHDDWQRLITEHPRLIVWSSTESGKSCQVSIGRVIWELGQNQSLRVAVVSNTHEQAIKIVRTIAKYIDDEPNTRLIFPDLRRSDPWTSSQLFVQRPVVSKDPSVQAFGVHGNVLGARLDLLILDDILDFENCRTPAMRKELYDWILATLFGRLTRDAKVVIIGTAFHPDDVMHRFATQEGWKALRYPVIDPATGRARWPERWPMSRIEARRVELGPAEFARQMLCEARDDSTARFKQEWVDKALQRGNGKALAYALDSVPPGCRTYTGVDLGVKRGERNALTVFFTILVHPNGDREVLCIESGKWAAIDIINRMSDTHRRYLSIMIVEDNAAQDFLVQFAQSGTGIPIRPFTTGRNKSNPEFGVESIATEMAGGKWIVPNEGGACESEVSAWISEMLYYDPNGHTGDRLMGSYFAREGTRFVQPVVEYGRLNLTAR